MIEDCVEEDFSRHNGDGRSHALQCSTEPRMSSEARPRRGQQVCVREYAGSAAVLSKE